MNTKMIIILAGILALPLICTAETYILSESGLEDISSSSMGSFAYKQSELKKLIDSGQTRRAKDLYETLRQKYPEYSGPDAESFMEAEMLYSSGKMHKAGKAYKEFAAKYPLSNWYEAAIERLYDVGTSFISGYKKPFLLVFRLSMFEDGAQLLNYTAGLTGTRPIAHRCLKTLATAYERRGDYDEAFEEWSGIYALWPTGSKGREAMLGMARSLHSSYQGPDYQSPNLDYAYNSYETFSVRYPEAAEELGVEQVQQQIRNQEAYKEYLLGMYYVKVGNFEGAELYFQNIIDNYDDTSIAEPTDKAMHELAKLREKVAENPPKERKGLWRFFDLFDIKKIKGYKL
ncbi:outer membrane assembly lipoprotein YfiO [Limihaloglobus sulfuriphilus]|uniref:Outer membrane assembly lipoprotein YfiO n=1 Tax=Limihaloglobus sulfuriphilus TaxID=1851148 RepID=A0A1Q2MEU5_9BACT|nr:tetratricopeptide repeat protein [Limihaloglobus sulfuriphilus]AQQ71226.1 outer membrane assembly lipoprotein YfiO [Limihaloglobus sulfuriphilus]